MSGPATTALAASLVTDARLTAIATIDWATILADLLQALATFGPLCLPLLAQTPQQLIESHWQDGFGYDRHILVLARRDSAKACTNANQYFSKYQLDDISSVALDGIRLAPDATVQAIQGENPVQS